jgi:hypothetical protein
VDEGNGLKGEEEGARVKLIPLLCPSNALEEAFNKEEKLDEPPPNEDIFFFSGYFQTKQQRYLEMVLTN